jgi:hypothetical protein
MSGSKDRQARQRSLEKRVATALDIAFQFGSIDGGHHKMWVIDQMVRQLTGKGYKSWVATVKDGIHGPDTYSWDEGIPP